MSREGEIELARWSNGYTLTRVTGGAREDLRHASRTAPLKRRALFVLRDGQGEPVFSLTAKHKKMFEGPRTIVKVFIEGRMLVGPGFPLAPLDRFPLAPLDRFRLHQKLLVSTIVEVLGVDLTNDTSLGPMLTPTVMWKRHFDRAMEIAEYLGQISDALKQEAAMKTNVAFRMRAELRRDYLNAALQQTLLLPFSWAIPIQTERNEPVYIASTSVKRAVEGVEDWMLSSQIVFDPEIRCVIRMRSDQFSHTNSDATVILGESNRSPFEAFVAAGLILPAETIEMTHALVESEAHFSKVLGVWADEVLEDAPEMTELFDTEPYRLLNEGVPYLWPLEEFSTWVETVEGSP